MRLTHLEQFAKQLAPELAAEPLYVFDHPASVTMPISAHGYTSHCTPALDDWLSSIGQFDGPGRHIVVCNPTSDDVRLPILLHEMAHCLPYTPRPVMPSREIADAEFAAYCVAPDAPAKAWSPPWGNDHGIEFIRIALHLWWRACLAGRFCFYQDVFDGQAYSLSPTIFYWQCLGGEALAIRDLTFGEIMATDPPALFSDLFLSDVRRWIQSNPQAKKEYENA